MKIVVDTKKVDGFGLNESYVEMLRAQWIENPHSVPKEWRDYFDNKDQAKSKNGKNDIITPVVSQTSSASVSSPVVEKADEKIVSLIGIQRKIAENMMESISVPTATSVRTMPVKVLEENRLVINKFC